MKIELERVCVLILNTNPVAATAQKLGGKEFVTLLFMITPLVIVAEE